MHSLLPHIIDLLNPKALAQGYGLINDIVNRVGNPLPFIDTSGGSSLTCTITGGACQFINVALTIIQKIRPIATIIGALIIVIMGTRMIIGQEDDRLQKTRTAMTALISGLVMIYLVEPFVIAFYGSTGEVYRTSQGVGVAVITTEVNGVINWVMVLAATLAILMIILSAVKGIMKGGGDESVSGLRKTVVYALAGIVLLVFRALLGYGFVSNTSTPVAFLAPIAVVTSFVLAFLALAFLCIVVYAGVSLIVSFGAEDQLQKAKSLLARAVIGLFVILVSYALVAFIIIPFLG